VLAPADRLERAAAVAVADQGEPEPAVRHVTLLDQLDLDAIGPSQPPGGDRDAPCEHGLQRAHRRQLLDQRRLEVGELGGILVRQHHMPLRAHAVLQRILRRTRVALFGPRAARLRAVAPARVGARVADRTAARRLPGRVGERGFQPRSDQPILHWTWRVPLERRDNDWWQSLGCEALPGTRHSKQS
jgi:hypothetical protein